MTKSGATTTRPHSAGTVRAPTSRVARTHASAIASRLPCMRENAGYRTSCTGPAMREIGWSMTL